MNTSVSPWLILLAMLVYGGLHSVMAALWFKNLLNRWLGDLAVRGYRLFYNFMAAVGLLPILALVIWLPNHLLYSISFPWLVLCLVGQALAVAALVIGVWQTGLWSFLGIEQLYAAPVDAPPKLVVRGLYRWVRHPLYTAGLAFIWLMPQMSLNQLALNLGLTVYIVVGAHFEERKLLAEYGEAYAAYRAKTPMLVPRLPSQ